MTNFVDSLPFENAFSGNNEANYSFMNEAIKTLLDNEPGVFPGMNVYISPRHCPIDKNRHANKFCQFSSGGVDPGIS